MPIFELDEGRPRLVQPMQPLTGSFAQECASLLTHHLAAIAGEPLFAVRSRTVTPDHADLPELLALDATGRSVVIDVVQVVDDDAVITALRHAGAASRMTTTDLARAYHPDPSRFAVDFAAFREQAAFGTQTNRREGVRLILLCSEVAAEAGDTLGFLRGPGRHVDVLQVGVVRGVDDRRLLDVSPLATHEGARRSVEPTALRLVRSSEGFATGNVPYEPRVAPGAGSRKPPSGELRAVTPPPAAPGPPAPTPLRTPEPVAEDAPRSTVHEAPTTLTPVVGLRFGADQVVPRTPPRDPGEVAGPRPFVPVSAPLPVSSSFPTPPAIPAVPPQTTEAIPPVPDAVPDADLRALPELATAKRLGSGW